MEIANQLMSEGFTFRNKQTAWEKVSQKWRNLERSYRAHFDHLSRLQQKAANGNGSDQAAVRIPDFFDDLHFLLANKYRTTGGFVQRAEQQNSEEPDMEERSMNGYENHEEEGENAITIEPGPGMYQEQRDEEEDLEQTYVDYVDNELPPEERCSSAESTVNDKSQILSQVSNDPHTATVHDPVVRLLLEMRAQERAHFREDRRERLQMQREMLDFRRELVDMLDRQHRERMEAMHALIGALTGQQQDSGGKNGHINNHKRPRPGGSDT